MGERTLRRLLIIGASAVVKQASRRGASTGSWLERMLARKPRMLVTVALAGHADIVRQILADAAGKPVVSGQSEEPVVLGSAILGAVAAGPAPDIRQAMRTMSSPRSTTEHSGGETADLHRRRFEIFVHLQRVAREARAF